MKSVAPAPVAPPTPVVIPTTPPYIAPVIVVANDTPVAAIPELKMETIDADGVSNEGDGPRWKKNFANYKKKGGVRKFFFKFFFLILFN